ncbi:hypothetical protein Tco_0175977, partial [Tanacetum coccineum]
WLGGPSLSETFPRLYRLEVSKDVRVVNRSPRYSPVPDVVPTPMIPESGHYVGHTNPSPNVIGRSGTYRLHFSWAWRRTPRYVEEIQELEALKNLVSQLQLSNSRDSWEFTACIVSELLVALNLIDGRRSTPWSSRASRWICA